MPVPVFGWASVAICCQLFHHGFHLLVAESSDGRVIGGCWGGHSHCSICLLLDDMCCGFYELFLFACHVLKLIDIDITDVIWNTVAIWCLGVPNIAGDMCHFFKPTVGNICPDKTLGMLLVQLHPEYFDCNKLLHSKDLVFCQFFCEGIA